MNRYCAAITFLIVSTMAPATAQPVPFSGFHAGPELGAVEQHFYLQETNLITGATRGRYYRKWGVTGGGFAGYDLPVGCAFRIGVEASAGYGGDNPVASFGADSRYTEKPRYYIRGVAKAGYVAAPGTLLYGTFGYGGQRETIADRGLEIDRDGARRFRSSFVIGAGVEHTLSSRAGIGIDFKHLDNDMSTVLIGVPIRF